MTPAAPMFRCEACGARLAGWETDGHFHDDPASASAVDLLAICAAACREHSDRQHTAYEAILADMRSQTVEAGPVSHGAAR